jgi:hypothetical protein
MKKNLLLFLFVWLFIFPVKAQDFHYSQFYAAPLYLNPALTGSTELSRVGVNYRKQWPGLAQDFSAYSAYFDHYSYDLSAPAMFLFFTPINYSWRTPGPSALGARHRWCREMPLWII